MIGLVGEPGMGKTRLVTEFCRSLAGQEVTVAVGQCLSYGQATPYLPVRDILRQVCGLAEGDAAAEHMAAVQHWLHASGMTAEEDVALLLQLLDLPVAPEGLARLSPEARQVRTFALLRHLVVHAAQPQPLVLVVENVHWVDPTSAAWLLSLVERLAGAAILLVGTCRPGSPLPWGAHAAGTQVALPPLRVPDSWAVVQAVLGAAVLPEARLRALLAQAGGNPFFLEELAWHAVVHDQPDTSGAVPETVQAVLAARMDRLSPAAKRLLQIAAVIGMDVSCSLLQALAEQPEEHLQQNLAHLQAAEFLYETRLFPEQEYTFKHALTHEVAYGSLLLERRRGLHARLVETLEALAPDLVDEQVERLAHHALRGEVWDKAVTYYQQAGARANDRAAFREAVAAFEQALQALAHLPDQRDTWGRAIDLRHALGGVLGAMGEHGRRLAVLGEAPGPGARRSGPAGTGAGRDGPGTQDDGPTPTAPLPQAGRPSNSRRPLASAPCRCALPLPWGGHTPTSATSAGGRAAAAERGGGGRGGWQAQDRCADPVPGVAGADLGCAWDLRRGRRHGEEALRLATLEDRGNTPIVAHSCLGHLYLAQGDLTHAIRVLEQGLALCRASSERGWFPVMVAHLGYAYALQGRLAEGRAAGGGDQRKSPHGRAARSGPPGRLAQRGLSSEGTRGGGLAARAPGARPGPAAEGARERGTRAAPAGRRPCLRRSPRYRAGRSVLPAGPDSGRGTRHAGPLQAHCHHGLGTLYARTGQQEQAHTALTTAIALYRAMDMTFWLPQAEAALMQVSACDNTPAE